MENDIFGSEIGSGFGEPGTPPPRIPRSTPAALPGRMSRCPHSTPVTQDCAEQIKIDVSRAINHDKLALPSSAEGYWCCRIAISIGIPSGSLCRGERTTQLLTLQVPISTYKFSKLISMHFLREFDNRSKHFLFSDHFITSHNLIS